MPRQNPGSAVGVERFFQFSLLGLISSGFLSVAGSGYLDTVTIALTSAGLLLRALLICGLVRLHFSARVTNLATLAYAVFFAADYFLLSREFLAATVHLLFFLAVMKILTATSNRDYLYTSVIAFLELLAGAILSANFNFFLFLALYLLFAIAALTSGEVRRSLLRSAVTVRRSKEFLPLRIGALSGMATLGILLLTAGLFFILPRTEAAFSHLLSHRIFLPGFSNQITLGQVGALQTSSRPVMHVRIWSASPVGPLKWRGASLPEFDGRRWTNPNRASQHIEIEHEHLVLAPGAIRPNGRRLSYHVDLEPIENDTLFFAGTPETLDLAARSVYLSDTATVRLGHPLSQGFRYDAWSLMDSPPETALPIFPPPVLPLEARELYLQLPRLDPRVAALARNFAGNAPSDLLRARAIENRLRTDYTYTLELPDREPPDPLADFLFVRKRGYCEYFASALAVMLRSEGIPARLATGFQSGVYNPVSGLWLVRASDAHSWVEAWIPGHGWSTFDATPPDLTPPGAAWIARLSLYMDAADTFWQEWVVAYDLTRQGTLAFRLEQTARGLGSRWVAELGAIRSNWERRNGGWMPAIVSRRFGLLFCVWLVGLLLLGVAARPLARWLRIRHKVARVRRGQASGTDATLLYRRMLHLLAKRGYQKPPWFTPAEFAASLPNTPLGDAVHQFTDTYNALRFGGHTAAASKLSGLLDRLAHE
jgi:protein-glutamine gamma-glutamyltransferase